jgi:glycosyltransferase involved in cell wall biosynthesis
MAYPAIKVKELNRDPEGIVQGSKQLNSQHCTRAAVERRPKLLFLAYAFPPLRAISSVRAWNIAKYLSRLGWEVTVVTPWPSLWRYIENPKEVTGEFEREGVHHIPTGHGWRHLMAGRVKCWNQGLGWIAGGACRRVARYLGIEGEIGWLEPAKKACSTLTGDDVDMILATGPPFVAFSLANWLSDKLRRPYVLDYRDLWSQNPHDALSPTLTVRREAELLAGCAAAVVVSRSCGLAIAQRFDLVRKIHVVTNGYEPETLADIESCDFGHFAIVYTGSFYPPKRVITPVMAALKRFKEIRNGYNAECYFHYYGNSDGEAHVRQEANRFGVIDRVVLHGIVSRAEALSAVRGAGVAVVITSIFEDASLEDKGIVTGKLFEALGLGTSILLIAPPGSDAREIVEEIGMGHSFLGQDIDGIVDFLSNIARTHNKRTKCADKYSWPSLAVKLDGILKGVTAAHGTVTS